MAATRERRRGRVSLRVSAVERSAIDRAAAHAGLCLSDYLRRVVLGAPPLRARRRPPLEIRLAARLLVQLGAVTAQLRVIAESMSVSLTPVIARDLARTLAELRACRQRLLSALGRRTGAS